MDTEIILSKYCCTCLSNDRKLFQLCRVTDGVNNLYWLLSCDSDAYREGFHKDSANLYICWECKAVMLRICGFRQQACAAQKQLSLISDGRNERASKILSSLTRTLKVTYDCSVVHEDSSEVVDNFVDCGPIADIKAESDLDDIPLAELHNNYMSDDDYKVDVTKTTLCEYNKSRNSVDIDERKDKNISLKPTRKKRENGKVQGFKKIRGLTDSNKKYYSMIEMNEEEMAESRTMRKLAVAYADAAFKCETCIEGFKVVIEFERHHLDVHTQSDKHAQCDICQSYVKMTSLTAHRKEHYLKYTCQFCDLVTYNLAEMVKHLRSGHATKNVVVPVFRKKSRSKTQVIKHPGSKPRRNKAMKDKRTPFGFLCMECNKYFDTKNLRWKHVQRHHREGFKCSTCGKKFPFKNNLSRHEQMHTAPPPREECAVCHKQVRADLLRVHARIHSERERFACVQCDKRFASRASYEHHLKYTQTHAVSDILKYKCSMCDKGYRSKGELRDHINYQHMGKTQHKCPICGKALATRRCITRHVRRAHDGIKENERDKICQQCGKAFRDKKGLREHEFIHTGERPLSCEICGSTFRQSASLYTHRKRVHKIYPKRRNVELMESEIPSTTS